MKKKVLLIFGTRPEAIKMAPVVLMLKQHPKLECVVAVTAQHRELLDDVLEVFEIEPDFDLGVMKKNQNLMNLTCDILRGVTDILLTSSPDLVLVHGDTTTTYASALASFYQKIPVAHVEAGLRSSDILSPWPEELNRQCTARISILHFAPTDHAKLNLINEGIAEETVCVTGNTVIDALLHVKDKFARKFDLANKFADKKVLVTCHRRENFGENLIQICNAICEIAMIPGTEVIFPVHPNPNVKEVVTKILADKQNVRLISPLSYGDFVEELSRSYLVISDSGGLQEEAPSLNVPLLILRDKTERPEVLNMGAAKLVGANSAKIIYETQKLLSDKKYYNSFIGKKNPYGDGTASLKILQQIEKFFLI